MAGWISRFAEMSPEERVMTVLEDPSTLSTLIADAQQALRALAVSGDYAHEQQQEAEAARTVLDSAVDDVRALKTALAQEQVRAREWRAEAESAAERHAAYLHAVAERGDLYEALLNLFIVSDLNDHTESAYMAAEMVLQAHGKAKP